MEIKERSKDRTKAGLEPNITWKYILHQYWQMTLVMLALIAIISILTFRTELNADVRTAFIALTGALGGFLVRKWKR